MKKIKLFNTQKALLQHARGQFDNREVESFYYNYGGTTEEFENLTEKQYNELLLELCDIELTVILQPKGYMSSILEINDVEYSQELGQYISEYDGKIYTISLPNVEKCMNGESTAMKFKENGTCVFLKK